MTNEEFLEQIQKLLEQEREQTKKMVREEIEAEGKRIHTDVSLLKVEVKAGIGKLSERMKDLEISHSHIEQKLEDVDLKIEAIRAFNKKAHAEIMDILTESNETNGQDIKRLEKRVQKIEEHLNYTGSRNSDRERTGNKIY